MSDLQESTSDTPRYPLPYALVHELRTPLNQIIGYSEMLSEQVQGGEQEGFRTDLEKISMAGQQMLSIIEANFDATAVEKTARVETVPIQKTSPLPLIETLGSSSGEGFLLVVDDNEGNREVLSRRLEKQGFTLAFAENGRQALEMLSVENYDLVLLDIMMPEMDGFEVLRLMKSDERMQHVPVIMISALSEMESVVRCIEMGADDYLTKPYNPILLKARIGASLQKKRSRDREIRLFEQLQQSFKELQNLEQLRDDLTHMIIHDLRTPLTSMMVALQTMDVVGEMNEGQREIMEIAMTGADVLLGMINSLLDVEKMESGGIELDYSLISLPELISSETRCWLYPPQKACSLPSRFPTTFRGWKRMKARSNELW